MGCFVSSIWRSGSLLLRTVEFPVFIHIVINAFHSPETQVVNILCEKIIYELQRTFHILTACGNGKPVRYVQYTAGTMPLIFHTLINRDRKRNIIASLLIQTCLFDRIPCSVCKIPPLVNHTEYTTGRKFGNILIIGLCKRFRIYNSFLVFLI